MNLKSLEDFKFLALKEIIMSLVLCTNEHNQAHTKAFQMDLLAIATEEMTTTTTETWDDDNNNNNSINK